MNANLTDQAVKLLVERGWPVFPCSLKKVPCIKWKRLQEQLPTAAEIREWGREFRPPMWGIVTGNLSCVVVIDFDGAEGIALMRKWNIEPHVRTGSGGFHWYLKHPGWRVPTLNAKTSKRSWPWEGLDIRGDGGFAVLLGRNSNGPYVQLRELAIDDFDGLPEEVRTFLRSSGVSEPGAPKPTAPAPQPTPKDGRVDIELLARKALEMAPNGRNDAGFWLACQLRDNGYGIGEAESAIRNYQSSVPSTNAKGQREPYAVAEAMGSLREAYSRPAREPWKRRNVDRCQGTAPPLSGKYDPGKGNGVGPKKKSRQDTNADSTESLGLYVDHTGDPLLDHTGDPLRSFRYGRIPWEVLCDAELEERDVRVYGMISGTAYQGSTSLVGTRRIAQCIHLSRRLVVESIHRLEQRGHIRICTKKRGHRGFYFLTSNVFSQKQRADVQEIVSFPRPRLVTVRKDQRTAWGANPAASKAKAKGCK
jgi:hypothetical protein